MLLKYAHSKIAAVGSLSDVLPSENKERGMTRVAALLPVARCLDDYLYVRSWAVSAGEIYGPNDNMDYFPKEELLKSYASFINTGFYKDHANHDIKLAYGLNLDAVYTPKDFVAVISAVKKAGLQPDQEEIAMGIKTGAIDQVSMGCQVELSICSSCGNNATNVGDYCKCLRLARGQRIAMATGYCEECGVTAARCDHVIGAEKLGIKFNKTANSSTINGQDLYEINRGCTFFDLSAITTVAADRRARIAEVIDKQASLFDHIKPLPYEIKGKDLGGEPMGKELEKEAAEKDMGGAHPNQPVKPVDAGDYDHKGNDSGRPEYGLADSGKSEAADKHPDIFERGRIDKGEYGPAGEDKGAKKPSSHDMYSDGAGAVSSSDVNSYRAKAASKEDDGFLPALKDFFKGMIESQAAKKEVVKPKKVKANIDYKALEEVRASLRDDLESLQEAEDALHDEKLRLLSKASVATLDVIKKKANKEIEYFSSVQKEISAARKMVLAAVEDMNEAMEEEAKGESEEGESKSKGAKSEVEEIRKEIDKLLDKVVDMVAGKKKEEKGDKKEEAGEEAEEAVEEGKAVPFPADMGGEAGGMGGMDYDMAAFKKKLAKHDCANCSCSDKSSCTPACQKKGKCAAAAWVVKKAMDGMDMLHAKGGGKGGKKSQDYSVGAPGNPVTEVQEDYGKDRSGYNRPGGALESWNRKSESATRKDIEAEKKYMGGKQQGDHPHAKKASQPSEWLALRRMAALTKKYVAEGMSLKQAKNKALDVMEAEVKTAHVKKADELIPKEQLIDAISDKVAKEILDSDPGNPENQAAAAGVHDAPKLEAGVENEAKQVFSDPDLPPAEASLKRQGYAEKGDSDKEPSDPYWDLFPEDNITKAVSEANGEMSSRSKETMREVKASVSHTQAPFSNNAAFAKQASRDGDSLMGSDSIQKVLEAIGLAERQVEAGLIDEAKMEEEAKRLFASSPEELKATAKVVSKVAKRNFKSPVPDGYMKQAMTMPEGEAKEESLFDEGEGIF